MNPMDDKICIKSIKQIMEIFGGKWSFLIIGELHTGSKHFNELIKNLGISTKALSDVLKKLELNGIITRTVHSTTPIKVEYSLTDKGRDFEEVFIAMRNWGMKWLKDE